MIFMGGAFLSLVTHPIDMAAALRFFTRRSSRKGCPCKDPDKEQFPVVLIGGALPCEFELPTTGDVEWLLFSYT